MAHNLGASPKTREFYHDDATTSSYNLFYSNPHAFDLTLLVDQSNPILQDFHFDHLNNPYSSLLIGNTNAPLTGITGFDEFSNLLFESLPAIEVDTTPDWIPAPYTPTFHDGNFSEALFEITENSNNSFSNVSKKPSLAYTAHKHLQQFTSSTSTGNANNYKGSVDLSMQSIAVKTEQLANQSYFQSQPQPYSPPLSNYLSNNVSGSQGLQSTSLPNSASKYQNQVFQNVTNIYQAPINGKQHQLPQLQLQLQLLQQLHQHQPLQQPHNHNHHHHHHQPQLNIQLSNHVQQPNHYLPRHQQVISIHSQTLPSSTSPLVAQYHALDLNLPIYPPRQFRNDLDLLYNLIQLELPLRSKKSTKSLVKKPSLSDTQKPKKHTRKRLLPRLKDGCWICRIKHLKCDECKPTCKLCERFGIECDYSPDKPEYVSDKEKRKEKLLELAAHRKPQSLQKKRSQRSLT